MSKRNSQESKRAARERLRIEREKQAKKARIRRQLVIGVSVVAVLALATGIGVAVKKMNEPSGWDAAKDAKLVTPANAEGAKGTRVVVGGKDAKNRIDVYEDLRCPACASFEQSAGKLLQKGADDGKYKLQLHLGSIIDNNLGGEGSKNAISALGAALDVSDDAFREYHEALYSKKNHPEETNDEFADDGYLLDVADSVKELKGNKGFQQNVEKGTFDKWALGMVGDFEKGKVDATPTVKVDGKKVETEQLPAELQKLGVDLGGGSGKE